MFNKIVAKEYYQKVEVRYYFYRRQITRDSYLIISY